MHRSLSVIAIHKKGRCATTTIKHKKYIPWYCKSHWNRAF